MTIAFQDIKTRLISVYLLIGLFVLNFAGAISGSNWWNIAELTVYNTLLITFIFTLTFVYFKWVRKIPNPLITHLGWGDVLFFLALTPLFYPLVYSYVFIAMTVLSTIIGIVLISIKGNETTIPHAGISALFFAVIILLEHFSIINLNQLLLW